MTIEEKAVSIEERAVAGILKIQMPGKEHKHLSISVFNNQHGIVKQSSFTHWSTLAKWDISYKTTQQHFYSPGKFVKHKCKKAQFPNIRRRMWSKTKAILWIFSCSLLSRMGLIFLLIFKLSLLSIQQLSLWFDILYEQYGNWVFRSLSILWTAVHIWCQFVTLRYNLL